MECQWGASTRINLMNNVHEMTGSKDKKEKEISQSR
jgi:hypothetical protein